MRLFQFCKQRRKIRMWLGVLLAAVLLAGCGKKQTDETEMPSDGALEAEGEEQDQSQQPKEIPELSEKELSAMQYVEKIEVEDYYGDGALYNVYAPKGSKNEEGMVSYFDHGLTYFASASNRGSMSNLYEYMEDTVEFTMEDWQDENFGNTDNIVLTEVMGNGDDRYQFASTTKENVFDGTSFEVRAVFYMDVQDESAGVLWSLELEEGNTDKETELIIDEIAACYRIDLDEIKTSVREWLAAGRGNAEKMQDVYEPEEGDLVLEEMEGYQYMGLVTLTAGDGETKCPVMAPRGWIVSAWENHVSSYMHGVSVTGSLGTITPRKFMKSIENEIDISYGVYQEDEEIYRNVQKTDIMPISGYEEALYAVISYEELDSYTQKYLPRVRVRCFMKVSDNYALYYDIKLSYDEYDRSTNTIIKELETAYGIDLSEYYNEEEK